MRTGFNKCSSCIHNLFHYLWISLTYIRSSYIRRYSRFLGWFFLRQFYYSHFSKTITIFKQSLLTNLQKTILRVLLLAKKKKKKRRKKKEAVKRDNVELSRLCVSLGSLLETQILSSKFRQALTEEHWQTFETLNTR